MSRAISAAARRVLFLAEDFAPGTAAYEFAQWLAGRGVAVEAIAAGGTRRGDAGGWWEIEERDGVRITRCPRRRAALARGLGYELQQVSFALSSAPILLDRVRHLRPQVIAAFDPPGACLPALRLAARNARALSWIHLPEHAAPRAAGLRRFGLVSLAAINAEARLAASGLGAKNRLALPPWIDSRAIFPAADPSPLRAGLELDDEAIVALYAGEIEESQGIDRLIAAARHLPANGAVVFVVSGRGAARAKLLSARDGAPVRLLPWPRSPDLNALLNLADFHLLPAGLAAPDRLFPAKPAALLASGRPILACHSGGGLPDFLADAVLSVAPNAAALAAGIVELAAAPAERRRRGAVARQIALDYHDKERVFRQIERALGLRPAQGLAAAS